MITTPPLPYEYNALENGLSPNAVKIHYEKHTQTYYDNVNELIKGTLYEDATDIESLLTRKVMASANSTLFNNIAQAWNHTFFWDGLAATSDTSDIGDDLTKHIQQDIESLTNLKKQLIDKAVQHFGSGWVWVVIKNGKLIVKTTPNASTPLVNGEYPLLCVDLWEHAWLYDPAYVANKPAYIKAMWGLINWKVVNDRYNKKANSNGR